MEDMSRVLDTSAGFLDAKTLAAGLSSLGLRNSPTMVPHLGQSRLAGLDGSQRSLHAITAAMLAKR